MSLIEALGLLRPLVITNPTRREALEVVTQRLRDQQAEFEGLREAVQDYAGHVEDGAKFARLLELAQIKQGVS